MKSPGKESSGKGTGAVSGNVTGNVTTGAFVAYDITILANIIASAPRQRCVVV